METHTTEFSDSGPFDLDVEQCFLGSLLLREDEAGRRRLRASLSRDDFYLPQHATIFDGACVLIDGDKPVDGTALRAVLKQKGFLEEIGGESYIGQILCKVPSHLHGEHYAAILEELSLRRQGVSVGQALAARLMRPAMEETATAVIATAIKRASEIQQRRSRTEVFSLGDIVAEFLSAKDDKEPAALLTGIPSLDEFCGLFGFGKYTIIGGRPSMGKSSAVRWLLGVWAKAGARVGLVAVEEDRRKIAGNYLSDVSGIENHIIAYHDFTPGIAAMATDAACQLAGYHWFGVDTAFSLSEVSAAVERLVVEKQCRIVAVDHIHLIRSDHRSENKEREISDISAKLKELGKRHGIVLIAAAQLSRPADKVRIPPAPTLTDLRQSGGIEEHADAVLFLHREDYYRRNEAPDHCCEFIIAKNRNARVGSTNLCEELKFQRFREPTISEASRWSNIP